MKTFYQLFREWLVDRKEEVVGYPNHPRSCPLAAFFEDNGLYATVRSRELRFDDYGYKVFHPEWASCFVHKVDNTATNLKEIIGNEALDMLDECAPKEELVNDSA